MEKSRVCAREHQITKQERIRQLPFFGRLNTRTINDIASIADVVRVPPGKAFYKEGAVGYELCIILEGQARVEKNGRTINRLVKNDLWGELSMVDRQPHIGTIVSESEVLMLVVESCYFGYLLELAPTLWKAVSITLSRYVRGLCGVRENDWVVEASGEHAGELPPALAGRPRIWETQPCQR